VASVAAIAAVTAAAVTARAAVGSLHRDVDGAPRAPPVARRYGAAFEGAALPAAVRAALSAFLSTFLSTSLLALQRNIYATADTQIRATKGQILRAAVSAVSSLISKTHGQRIWYEEHLKKAATSSNR
jgi:hypothetical protein